MHSYTYTHVLHACRCCCAQCRPHCKSWPRCPCSVRWACSGRCVSCLCSHKRTRTLCVWLCLARVPRSRVTCRWCSWCSRQVMHTHTHTQAFANNCRAYCELGFCLWCSFWTSLCRRSGGRDVCMFSCNEARKQDMSFPAGAAGCKRVICWGRQALNV